MADWLYALMTIGATVVAFPLYKFCLEYSLGRLAGRTQTFPELLAGGTTDRYNDGTDLLAIMDDSSGYRTPGNELIVGGDALEGLVALAEGDDAIDGLEPLPIGDDAIDGLDPVPVGEDAVDGLDALPAGDDAVDGLDALPAPVDAGDSLVALPGDAVAAGALDALPCCCWAVGFEVEAVIGASVEGAEVGNGFFAHKLFWHVRPSGHLLHDGPTVNGALPSTLPACE